MAELRHRVHIKDEKLQHHEAGEEEVESKRQDEGARHILAAVLLVVAALFWLVFRALRTSRPETKTLYEVPTTSFPTAPQPTRPPASSTSPPKQSFHTPSSCTPTTKKTRYATHKYGATINDWCVSQVSNMTILFAD